MKSEIKKINLLQFHQNHERLKTDGLIIIINIIILIIDDIYIQGEKYSQLPSLRLLIFLVLIVFAVFTSVPNLSTKPTNDLQYFGKTNPSAK